MAKFGERLRTLRVEKGLSMLDFANDLGISKSSVNMYERGEREPNFELLEAFADYFNVDMDYLLGKSDFTTKFQWMKQLGPSKMLPDNILPMPKMRKIPLLGSIACGAPILADEHIEGYVDIPDHIDAQFTLRCKGDSMINARIYDGDIVYIRQQEEVNNGEIAAVLVNDEATLKRVKFHPDRIILEPANPLYDPLVYRGEEMNSIHILGKAVAFTSTIR